MDKRPRGIIPTDQYSGHQSFVVNPERSRMNFEVLKLTEVGLFGRALRLMKEDPEKYRERLERGTSLTFEEAMAQSVIETTATLLAYPEAMARLGFAGVYRYLRSIELTVDSFHRG